MDLNVQQKYNNFRKKMKKIKTGENLPYLKPGKEFLGLTLKKT